MASFRAAPRCTGRWHDRPHQPVRASASWVIEATIRRLKACTGLAADEAVDDVGDHRFACGCDTRNDQAALSTLAA
jgi:hypothetical protein